MKVRVLTAVVSALAIAPASAAPLLDNYSIAQLGFTDAEHINVNSNNTSVSVRSQNEAGQVIGQNARYDASGNQIGTTVWQATDGVTTRLGFTDAQHTGINDFKNSQAYLQNEDGQVVGLSTRFRADGTYNGLTAWQAADGSTTRIGLVDAEHSGNDELQRSQAYRQNEAGQVVGRSYRYDNNGNANGQSSWQATDGVTQRIGLTDAAHTGSNNFQYSDGYWLNEAGQVIGRSYRYDANGAGNGHSAWQATNGVTTRLGYTDAQHTGYNGVQDSHAQAQNEAGQVVGRSIRYGTNGYSAGMTAWQSTDGVMTRIGLTNAEHTGANGYYTGHQSSYTSYLNEAGQVVGQSNRYNSNGYNGYSAWQATNGVTMLIGLTDGEHTNTSNRQENRVKHQNEAGHVVGQAKRYYGNSDNGYSIWQAKDGVTTRLGLTDADHTGVNGLQNSHVSHSQDNIQNEAGQVIGSSIRYASNGYSAGSSAWQATDGVTKRLGLTDARHTGKNSYSNKVQSSYAQIQNQAGQVVGGSTRYDSNGGSLGTTAWFWDNDLGEIFDFDLSFRDDGYGYSHFNYLGDDGLGLGHYSLYDGADFIGARAFGFTLADGFFDLSDLVSDVLAIDNWDHLAQAVSANDAGQIIGYGVNADGYRVGFQLSEMKSATSVSEPATVALFGFGMLMLFWVRRKTA